MDALISLRIAIFSTFMPSFDGAWRIAGKTRFGKDANVLYYEP